MDKDELIELINNGFSRSKIAQHFSKKPTTINYWLKKYNLKTNPSRFTSPIWTVSLKEIQRITSESDSLAEILRKLGYSNHLGSELYKSLKERLKNENISIKHIPLGIGSSKGRIFKEHSIKYTRESYLIRLNESRILYSEDRLRLIKFNIIPHTNCAICNQSRLWNGKPLTLQIDHIDGNPFNNIPFNLRFVCPNCHTQTKTFCIGNKKKRIKQCIKCGKQITKQSERCKSCAGLIIGQTKLKFNPTKEELIDLVCKKKIPFTTLGKKYNVSDNAVRKRCIKFGIDPRTRKLKE